ncbi:hypothetical protein RclHR1_02990008 [Rhizophagus clarus]|uniref:Uncharacterized protein n=1 Tax=Rhizophagus clarus TaxID=94130 RepID=A0A2Z6R4W6_9GLOM|nr:hypothetical protein RclHR1_02990008 [Rhizophagus clarus]GES88171.1 hypothetical protein GLOIN_2v1486670 [Rhizophagus clarus]
MSAPQASDFKPITFEAKPNPELIIKSVLEHFPYLKFGNSFRGMILHHLSRGAHHVLFAMEIMGIMDYMANGMEVMEQNIVLLASLQAINSNSRLWLRPVMWTDHLKCAEDIR